MGLPSSVLRDEIAMERVPSPFSDEYGWQVNTKSVATATSIQER